jgi:hypothetical protein
VLLILFVKKDRVILIFLSNIDLEKSKNSEISSGITLATEFRFAKQVADYFENQCRK